MINNIKAIREIYGATQTDIADSLGISRVTLAKWENNEKTKAPQSILEKLSLFFGIGPEYFYDMELDNKVTSLINANSNHAKKLDSENDVRKEDKFKELFLNTNFKDAISKYMFSMKLLLALSDQGEINDLEIICKINEKMNARLKAIIDVRKEEIDKNSMDTLFKEFSFNVEE